MIQYRSFRNTDPPAIVGLWNASLSHTRIVPVPSATFLEYFTFAKNYFDYDGFIVACEGDKLVGFVHAGFGPRPDQAGLDSSLGVICVLGVLPSYRRCGIGSQLLLRAEAYLRQRGASTIFFGSQTPNNPFLFGLHGGCTNVGIVHDDPATLGFMQRHHFRPYREMAIHRRSLARLPAIMDTRFGAIRTHFDIVGCALRRATWWQESTLGPVDAVEYYLQDRATRSIPARMVLWDMEPFHLQWGESCVGLIDLFVQENCRRLGLAKYLVFHVLRHLRERSFSQFEAAVDMANPALMALLHTLEFEPIGAGMCYYKELS